MGGHMAGHRKSRPLAPRGRSRFTLAGDARDVFRRASRSRWYHVEGGGLFKSVLLRLGVSSDGVYECTGIALGLDGDDEGAIAIPARALRVPLADIVAALSVWAFGGATWPKPKRGSGVVTADGFREFMGFYQQGAAPTPRVALGRRPRPDGFYEVVAENYRAAQQENPRAPMTALAAMRSEAPRTLKHLVSVARKKGYLKKWQPPKRRKERQKR
jgi:hypothetical protein